MYWRICTGECSGECTGECTGECVLEIYCIKAQTDELETGGEHGREGRIQIKIIFIWPEELFFLHFLGSK